jgi:hypothetical protein
MQVNHVCHRTILGVLHLEHLLQAQVLEDSSDRTQGVAVARYGHVARFSFQPFLKLPEKGQCSAFHHLEAFALRWWKIVASMDLGIPFRPFFGEFSLALPLEEPIATFDEPIVCEDLNGVMSLKDYFQGLLGASEMRAESVVNLFCFELLSDFI